MRISIQTGDAKLIAELSRQLPEFHDPYDETAIEKRMKGVPNLTLIAYFEKIPVGFKVGYDVTHNLPITALSCRRHPCLPTGES